jgi:3-hydroxyisobutyrate dehydrogenase-like beta-hydroxyacid dehydrogenase
MDVGFIGLGAMGSAMARNLIKAGHTVRVWNRSPGPAEELAREGAVAVNRAADAAHGDVLVSMLADDAALRAVLFAGGVLEAASPSLVHVGCSSISVALGRELARAHGERGVSYISAPVFGRPDVAAQAKLNIVAAGAADAIARAQPVLDAMGQKTWVIGAEPYMANLVKIGGNLMIASAIEAMSETAALGAAHDIDPGKMLEIYTSSLFACRAYQSYAPGIAERRFEPAGFKLKLGLKDVRLALEAGDAASVPLPFGSALRDAMLTAIAFGDGEKDWSALAEVARKRAGL